MKTKLLTLNMRRSAKILILILDGIIKKISYERRDYEAVDEKKSLSWAVPKNYEKNNSGSKGLNKYSNRVPFKQYSVRIIRN